MSNAINLNSFFAGIICAVWIFMVIGIGWNKKYRVSVNIIVGLLTVLFIAAVHWVPFWLIFLRS